MMKYMSIGSYAIIDDSSPIVKYRGWLVHRISVNEVEAVGRPINVGWSAASQNNLPVRLLSPEELLEHGIVYYGSQKTLWSPP